MPTTKQQTTYTEHSFTQQEVAAKIGQAVQLMTAYQNLRPGTKGNVVDFDEANNGELRLVVKFTLPAALEATYKTLSKTKYFQYVTENIA